MKIEETKIKELVEFETKKVKRKRPDLEEIDLSYNLNNEGLFCLKIHAKTKNKTIVLSNKGLGPEAAVRKIFSNLIRILSKRKHNKSTKYLFDFKEAI
ncbi:MAG: hypothetical protein H6622_10305 [Halobacteriovoraceae bacterium]|nr:hypothetical protein [Halobacteriovoraceae bacterium]